MIEWLALALVVGLGWLVADGFKARELAYASARAACTEAGVQFLDDTVSLNKMRVSRNANGQVALERWFRFEFSTTGDDRQQGNMRVLGHAVQEIRLARLWLVQSPSEEA